MIDKIPKMKMPEIDGYPKMYMIDEKFVSLTDAGLLVDSQYVKYGSPTDCYARETVANLLKTADKVARDVFGVRLLILDAYRPVSVQTALWDKYYGELKAQYPNLAEEELIPKVTQFVSQPSEDILYPSVHNTGGAIDVTLVRSDGTQLDMGTEFDDFSEKASTAYFEKSRAKSYFRNRRRMLYSIMTSVGFTNLPSEWWHYDYGDAFYAYYTCHPRRHMKPLYSGITDDDFNRIYLKRGGII